MPPAGADPRRWQVRAFLDDMPACFAKAHLVMARSGASTVAELAAAGKPSLLVPFAAAADEHQKRNAEAMEEAGAAVMLAERELGIPGPVARYAGWPAYLSGAVGRHGPCCAKPGSSRCRRTDR